MRIGRFSDALRLFDEVLTRLPERADIRNVRTLLAPLRGISSEHVQSTMRSTFACATGPTGVRLPLSVNGKPVSWLLDIAFTMPAVSEAEALMLGLRAPGAAGVATDGSGGSTTVRTVVVDHLVIGGTELRNVPMLVFPDSQPPWNELRPGSRGIVGLPVALSLQNIRWTSRGTCETGPVPQRSADDTVNLAFNGLEPVTRVAFDGRPLDFLLDTGNQTTTQLWSRFAADFSELAAREGRKGRARVTQIGGSNDRDVVLLPEVRLRVGRFDTVLRPANIFPKPVGDDRLHGNLGMDLLSQADEVTLDFQSMVLSLR
jgi:hypothetical protein